jgi:plastocyanin
MRCPSTKRTLMLWAVLAMPVAVSVSGVRPALASGGGGCGRPLTDRNGVSVAIKDFCFGPTVIRLRAGQSVTWTNRDPFVHTVLGANGLWGSFEELGPDQTVVYRFDRTGVFPYACTVHTGMVGAVVVGRSPTLGSGSSAISPVIRGTSPSDPAVALPVATLPALTGAVASSAESPGGNSSLVGTVVVFTELAILLGFGGLVWRRRRMAASGRRATSLA